MAESILSRSRRSAATDAPTVAARIERAGVLLGFVAWWCIPVVAAFVHGGTGAGAALIAVGGCLVAGARRYLRAQREDARRDGFCAGRLYGAMEESAKLRALLPNRHSDPATPE